MTYRLFASSSGRHGERQVAVDASANEKSESGLWSITIFLSSYVTGRNLTVSNGTATLNDASLGSIMEQESGSTVKHVNWRWPACLADDGGLGKDGSDRGDYNVSSPVLHHLYCGIDPRLLGVSTGGRI